MQRVDGKEYGNVQGTNRKKVHEDAALQALDKLCELLTLHSKHNLNSKHYDIF